MQSSKRFVAFCLTALWTFTFAMNAAQSNSTNQTEAKVVQSFYSELVGDWSGSYSLWLDPEAEPQVSTARTRIEPAANNAYYLMTYDWDFAGKPQAGVFLFGGRDKTASASWGDSFHMTPDPMQCQGTLSDDGNKLSILGSYGAGSGPDWGWRTDFTRQGSDTLVMEAYNITPDGEEGLAVRAEFHRTEQ